MSALVPASAIAKRISCSAAQVHLMAKKGKISCHRLDNRLVRFDTAVVEKELGLKPGTLSKQP